MNPYLLCGHLDVVAPGDTEEWVGDPFQEQELMKWFQDGEKYVYGRGAIDDKHTGDEDDELNENSS